MKYLNLILVASFVTFFGCKSEMIDYNGKDGVYFAMQEVPEGEKEHDRWAYTEMTELHFFKIKGDEHTVNLYVRIMGNITNYDRQFKLISSGKAMIEGDNFEPLNEYYTIKAGEFKCKVPIIIKRTPKLKEQDGIFPFKLVETTDFVLPMDFWPPMSGVLGDKNVNVLEHTIKVTDKMSIPAGWYDGVLGPFSEKKVNVITSIYDVTYDQLDDKKYMTTPRLRFIGQTLKRYLKEMDDKGETIYENGLDSEGNKQKMMVGEYI